MGHPQQIQQIVQGLQQAQGLFAPMAGRGQGTGTGGENQGAGGSAYPTIDGVFNPRSSVEWGSHSYPPPPTNIWPIAGPEWWNPGNVQPDFWNSGYPDIALQKQFYQDAQQLQAQPQRIPAAMESAASKRFQDTPPKRVAQKGKKK